MKNIILAVFAFAVFVMPSVTEAHDEGMMCTAQYQPVCGTENGVYKTYGNGCTLAAEDAVYQHEGECTAAELKGHASASVYVPPAHCVAWNDGCNSCGRGADGQAFCTLMACMGEPRAGYCTKYAETETPDSVQPAPGKDVSSESSSGSAHSGTSVVVEATTSIATTSEVRVGFFARIWTNISSWFAGLF